MKIYHHNSVEMGGRPTAGNLFVEEPFCVLQLDDYYLIITEEGKIGVYSLNGELRKELDANATNVRAEAIPGSIEISVADKKVL